MQTIVNAGTTLIITTGATSVLFVVNPYIFYALIVLFSVTCMLTCISIIRNCDARNKRIEAMKTRKSRRSLNASEDSV